jgi:hypothetical protein
MPILEMLWVFGGKAAGSLIKPAYSWAVGIFRRPSVVFPRAPKNILEVLRPGTTIDRAIEVLGPPHRSGLANSGIEAVIRRFPGAEGFSAGDPRKQYSWEFSDVLFQVRSGIGTSIDELHLVAKRTSRSSTFPVYPLNIVLGKSKLSEVLEADEEALLDMSAKHHARFTRKYFGNPGNYLQFVFGCLETNYSTGPKDETINWVVMSFEEIELPYFDWAHFY